ncbi:MAG TPA: UDP-N-acetylmuramoyl-tripeptide--D-alanyl-D-alanine ligase [Acidisarcina sp.]
MRLGLGQIAGWMGAELVRGSREAESGGVTGYSIDSRTLQPGDLFFAVRGERVDGHDFVEAAMERGAWAAVVARGRFATLPELVRAGTLLVVEDDPLAALQRLAAAVRRHWGRRVVGITGSAGKTTTKDAVAAVLARRFKVLKSEGNLNNHFGLPLQLLKLEPEHEVAVIEMGMSAAGEIAALAKIARPDWGVVTNVGNAHAENFPTGIAGVARAKYELIEALPADGVAFLNCDDSYVSQFGRGFRGRVVHFGAGPCADPRVEEIEEAGSAGVKFKVRAGDRHAEVTLSLLGRHNVANALAALAVGLKAGVSLEECVEALEGLRAADRRGEVLTIRGATVINDCYNSNPEALQSMIGTLVSLRAARRILVAGEMLELGRESAELHRACGRSAAERGIDIVAGVRGNAKLIVEGAAQAGAEARYFETPEEAGEWLAAELREGDAVLLKGSRGVRLERALRVFEGG